MSRLRISAISYLNTAPLMWSFEHGNAGEHFDISYTVPSLCAESLRSGSGDIGIIPSVAYPQIPSLAIIPDVAIAARRAVRSILLVSQVPLQQIRRVALDTSSMTSVALTRILFAKWWMTAPVFTAMAPDLEKMLEEHDAGLVIGDPALQVDRTRYLTFDLAEEWIRFTRRPFVFAFWAVRQPALKNSSEGAALAEIFQKSRDQGLQPHNLRQISQTWASRLRLTEDEALSYLTQNIHYFLDAECLAGLSLFYQYAAEIGILPAAPALHFVDTANAVAR
jgi:chorismate dehydratase